MSELLLSNRPLNAQEFANHCGFSIDQLTACGCIKPSSVAPNTPYLIGADTANARFLGQLAVPPVARSLTDLSLSFGSDSLLPLANIRERLYEAGAGILGETAGLSNKRGSAFVVAVKDYQKTLLDYRRAVVANAPNKASARQAAQRAFDEMQWKFRAELNTVTAQVKARRGTPLTNAERGINIARSSRSVAKLHVADQIEAHMLVKLTRHARLLTNGLAVIDFGAKVGNIHNEYKAGGNWHRQMFIESSSFAASAVTASAVVNAGGAALTFLAVATPVGWIGLLIGGLTVAAAAAGSSIWVNNQMEKNSGGWYDTIMKHAVF